MSLTEKRAVYQAAGLIADLSDHAIQRVETYFDLRSNWSRAHNIAGPRAMRDPWITDFIDAVAIDQALTDDLPLVDVGTGSGTPGLLLACLRPDHPIILVEPIAKRTAFLRHATHALALKSVVTIRGHWPSTVPNHDVQVISRAVVSPQEWPQLAASAGEQVIGILRVLAAQRPQMGLDGFYLGHAVDYVMPDASSRRIERWDRSAMGTDS